VTSDASRRARFEHEGRALAALNHPASSKVPGARRVFRARNASCQLASRAGDAKGSQPIARDRATDSLLTPGLGCGTRSWLRRRGSFGCC
jgi:hypothetical protein